MHMFQLKRIVIVLHDILWIPVSIVLAYWFRFNLAEIPTASLPGMQQLIIIAIPLHSLAFWYFGCYRGIWRFASIPDLMRLLKAVATATVISAAILFFYSRFQGVPRSAMVLYPMMLLMGVASSRFFYRLLKTHRVEMDAVERERALIVGAGRAGNILVKDLLENGPFIPVGFVDDDREKKGTDLHGVRVVGEIANINELIDPLNVQVVLIAMPSVSRMVMDKIVSMCSKLSVPCRTLPSLLELADGRVEVSRLRPVTVQDLLGREAICLDNTAIDAYLHNKGVVVTGGGGSIGSELCRQVLMHNPKYLLIIESSEFNLYEIESELINSFPNANIITALADVCVEAAITNLFARYQPEVVFHAAAYKHVPIVESNIVEGVRNNVFGTRNVADIAVKFGVKAFVLVSTDKTVNPTNIMGASKRIAEIYCQSLNKHVNTHFITTRFGNVLGSAGSVVPLFERQIKSGGPVTVTHSDITRYFMTIPEAASLILQAGSMGKGGEIFVLDMGEPIKIKDLAENMIRLSGLKPGEDIHIEYVGLRPGEKMHEELFYTKEKLVGTSHPKLLLANCCETDWACFQRELLALVKAVEKYDEASVIEVIKNIVPEFNRNEPLKKIKNQDELREIKRSLVI